MSLRTILFLSLISVGNAFLLPPQILPILSKLEGIITSKAISTSFLMNLRNEITVERIFTEVTEFDYHSKSYFYMSIFLTYIYGQYKYMKGSQTNEMKIQKLKKIEKYERIDRLTREIIFIILFIFTKDVQRVM